MFPKAPKSPLWSGISILSFVLIYVIGSAVVFAQADAANSTLKGKVVDQLGAAVSGATISVKSAERGLVRSVKTDSAGSYLIPLLQPGTYEVRVTADGFRPETLPRVVLTVGQIQVQDIKIQVSDIKEAVNVNDSSALVETERTQQSDTIERRQLTNLPNLSRNLTSYILTLPGVADVAAARV